jgi:hypothetical protein
MPPSSGFKMEIECPSKILASASKTTSVKVLNQSNLNSMSASYNVSTVMCCTVAANWHLEINLVKVPHNKF